MPSLTGNKPNQVPLNADLGNLAYQNASSIAGPVTVGGSVTANGVVSDTISEKTSATGVTIDGVLLKDSAVSAPDGGTFTKTTATTNAVTQVLRVDSQSSGTPANGIGVGIEFATETAAGNTEVGATIEAITTDVTSTSEDFDLSFKTMAAGAVAAERMRIASTGIITSPISGLQIVSGTSVASTSGTSIDFTGIPSWVKRITVMFNGISTNGTSNYFLQIGDSGGIETTGYVSGVLNGSTVPATTTSTSAFLIDASVGTGQVDNGMAVIANLDGNLWVCNSILNNAGVSKIQGGTKTLSATLDRVRITTANGTDTFDAGSINILYE